MTNRERILNAWGENNEIKYPIGFGQIVGKRTPEGEYLFSYMYTKNKQIVFGLDGNEYYEEITWDKLDRDIRKNVYEFMKRGGLFYPKENLLSYEEISKQIIEIFGDDNLGEEGEAYFEPEDYIIIHGKIDDDEFAPYNISGASTQGGEVLVFFDNNEGVSTLRPEEVSLIDANILLSRIRELEKAGRFEDEKKYYEKLYESMKDDNLYKDWGDDEDTSTAEKLRYEILEFIKKQGVQERCIKLSPYVQVGPCNFLIAFHLDEDDRYLDGFELDMTGGSVMLKETTYSKVLKNLQKQVKEGKSIIDY